MKVFKKMRLKVTILALLVITIAGVGITYAYLKTQTGNLNNQFKVGEITTKIEEDTSISGSTINKNPSVMNIGKNDSIIRMRVTISPKKISDFLKNNNGVNYDTTHWSYNEDDGFWYYKGVVKPNNATEPLFTEVKGLLKDNSTIIKEFEKVENFEITLYQESVQAIVWDKEGNSLNAADNGTYSQDKAMKIWEAYQAENKE